MTTVLPSPYVIFPECPGYGFTVQPWYLVNIVMREQGFERADQRWARCMNLYTAVPLGPRDEAEIQSVLYFWHAMGGREGVFRFLDWGDYKSCPTYGTPAATDQPLVAIALSGGGNGYRLLKRYVVGALAGEREITQPDAETVLIANASGIAQTDYTIDEGTGIVVPGSSFAGVPHSWGGEFYVPVRFDSELDTTVADKQIQSVQFTLREKRLRLTNVFAGGSGGSGGSPGGADPLSWILGTGPGEALNQLAVAGGIAVGTGSDTGTLYRATAAGDYDDWASVGDDGGLFPFLIGAGGSTFIADSGNEDGTVIRSTDGGATWGSTIDTGIGAEFIEGIATDGAGHWIVVGDDATASTSSDDGASWTPSAVISPANLYFYVTYDTLNDVFIAGGKVADNSNDALYVIAKDGTSIVENVFDEHVTFESQNLASAGTDTLMLGVQIDTSGVQFFSRFASSAAAMAAASETDTGLTEGPQLVLAGDGHYFAIGNHGSLAHSTDKSTWSTGTTNTGTSSSFFAGFYDAVNKLFVVVNGVSTAKSMYTAP